MSKPSLKVVPDLENLLCFSIYSAGLAFNGVYRRLLSKVGLTYPQYLVMVALWSEDRVTIGRLGDRLSLDTNTLTPMLKRLEAMQLLTRKRDDADERRVMIALTQKGRSMEASAGEITRCIGEAAGMPLDDIRRLTGEMQALRKRLEAYGAGAA